MAFDMPRLVSMLDQDSGAAYKYAKTEEDFDSIPVKQLDRIGRGSNGLILLMTSTSPETPETLMAAKNFLFNYSSDTKNERKRKIFMKETAALQNFSHKNIAKICFSVMGPQRAMILMDYYDGKALYTHDLKKELVPKYFLNILDAVNFIHSKRVIHRDLKLDNILEKDEDVFLTDFGISEKLSKRHNLTSGLVGTLDFMAPEVFHSCRYSLYDGFKADSYSMGVILFTLLLQVDPPSDDHSLFKLGPILECSPKFESLDWTLKDCALQLLEYEPEDRVSVTSLHASLCQRGFYNSSGANGEDKKELGGDDVKDKDKLVAAFEGWNTLGAKADDGSDQSTSKNGCLESDD